METETKPTAGRSWSVDLRFADVPATVAPLPVAAANINIILTKRHVRETYLGLLNLESEGAFNLTGANEDAIAWLAGKV